jgi:hypothetical protein
MMYRDIPQGEPDLNTLVAEYRQVMEAALKTSGGDMQKVVDALNAYTKQKYPTAKLLTIDDFNKTWADYGFMSEEKSAALYFSLLKKDGKITAGEADFLTKLDAVMVTTKGYQAGLDAVKKAQTDLSISSLSKEEKEKIGKMLEFIAANYNAKSNETSNTSSQSCEDCLRNHIWPSLAMGAVIFAICAAATAVSGGALWLPCLGMGLFVSIISLVIDCPMCYNPPTPPVPCKECPKDFPYDGANCYSGICAPVGTVPFVYGNAFYYTAKQPNNQCPIGQFYDGANCYKQPMPANYQGKGFILNRCYYVKPICK